MPRLLTKRKDTWAKQFNPKVLRGTALNPNISAALRYQKKLDALIKRMVTEVKSELKKLFKTEPAQEYFAQDASISSQARILTNALTVKYNEIFARLAKPLAEQVTAEANKSSTTALHASLQQLSGGLSLKTSSISPDIIDVLNATTTQNVALIKSISAEYLSGVQGAVMRSITDGQGSPNLIPYLQKHEGITYRRARFIAHDQTRKAFNNINTARMRKLGIKEFEWLHSGGSNHPRKEHIELSGKIFPIDRPPIIDKNTGERGLPGQLPGCRCRQLPVIRFDEE